MSFSINYFNCSDQYRQEIEVFVSEWQSKKDNFSVQTSGSTGTPKTISLTRKQLTASAKRSNAFFKLTENSTACLCISPEKIGGKMVLVRAMVGDYSVDVFPVQANPFERHQLTNTYDFVSLIPYQIQAITAKTPEVLNLFKSILLGGMQLSSRLENEIKAIHSNTYIGFGMTETVSHIALRKLGSGSYTVMDGVTISSNRGCLVLSDRFLGIEQLSTTDLVDIKSQNQFNWLGRKDFAINSGGIKIHPEMLEQTIIELIDSKFIIAGLPDEKLGERCVLIVEKLLCEDVWNQIKELIQQEFGPYFVPKEQIKASILTGENNKTMRLKTIKQLTHDPK